MAAVTMDHLSGGRFCLGLGVSGPQVVEGWYGQEYPKPLARTREYVEIVRRVLRREEPLDFQGEFYQHPYHGEGSVGLGKPLRSITHPLRADIPILLGAEGPKNVAMAAEIAEVYRQRWNASETTLGEGTSTVTDAGPSRGPRRPHTHRPPCRKPPRSSWRPIPASPMRTRTSMALVSANRR